MNSHGQPQCSKGLEKYSTDCFRHGWKPLYEIEPRGEEAVVEWAKVEKGWGTPYAKSGGPFLRKQLFPEARSFYTPDMKKSSSYVFNMCIPRSHRSSLVVLFAVSSLSLIR